MSDEFLDDKPKKNKKPVAKPAPKVKAEPAKVVAKAKPAKAVKKSGDDLLDEKPARTRTRVADADVYRATKAESKGHNSTVQAVFAVAKTIKAGISELRRKLKQRDGSTMDPERFVRFYLTDAIRKRQIIKATK